VIARDMTSGIAACLLNFFAAQRILCTVRNVLADATADKDEEWSMQRMLVRYRAKPEKIEENQRLIGEVFRELHAKSPSNVRYLVLKLSDGTFYHLVEDTSKTIPSLEAFAAFRRGGEDRRIDEPQQLDATVIGNYRMLAEP
jgi:hypothetical protein